MNNLKNVLLGNKELLSKSLKIDNAKWNETISQDQIFNAKKLNINLLKGKTYLIIHDGSPSITEYICEKAIDSEANVIFTMYDYFLATNSFIVAATNKILQQINIHNFVKLYYNVMPDVIFESSKSVFETIYIGDEYNFQYYKANIKSKIIKISYYSDQNNIDN